MDEYLLPAEAASESSRDPVGATDHLRSGEQAASSALVTDLSATRRKSSARRFDIRVRGQVPEDLRERVSGIHAAAIELAQEPGSEL